MLITFNIQGRVEVTDGLSAAVEKLIQLGERMARTLDETLVAVEAANTKQDSLIALFKGLKQQLADILAGVTLPPGVQAKVDAVFDSVAAQAAEVSEALDENVPPAP